MYVEMHMHSQKFSRIFPRRMWKKESSGERINKCISTSRRKQIRKQGHFVASRGRINADNYFLTESSTILRKRRRNTMEPSNTQELITFSTIEGANGDTLDKIYGFSTSFLKVHPSKCILPTKFVFYARKIRDMEVHNDDVWMVSYPRTGSHWAQEMVWCIGHNFDYEAAQQLFMVRNPLLEASALMNTGSFADWFAKLGDSVDNIVKLSRPRYLKTHLPWDLLPTDIKAKKPKIVYVARNPKDTCVSFYHYCKLFHAMEATFDDFAELFLTDHAPIAPFWSHVLKFWEMRDQENVLFLKYEDMKRDQAEVVKKTAKFLGKTITDDQIVELCEHLKFSKMAANPSVNLVQVLEQKNLASENSNMKFIRKGKVGDWRNYMSEDLSRRFDEWTEKNLRGTGLSFETEAVHVDEE